jgi:hypothetical protein
LSEELRVTFRCVVARCEIGYREARLFDAKAGSGANPVLGEGGVSDRHEDGEQ